MLANPGSANEISKRNEIEMFCLKPLRDLLTFMAVDSVDLADKIKKPSPPPPPPRSSASKATNTKHVKDSLKNSSQGNSYLVLFSLSLI